jgi:hypothetical protein
MEKLGWTSKGKKKGNKITDGRLKQFAADLLEDGVALE